MTETTQLRLKGRALIENNPNNHNRLGVRYDTVIFHNTDDPLFINKLSLMGCQVLSFIGKYIKLVLPFGWVHVAESRQHEYILDEQGRKRLDLTRKPDRTTLVRRYDFILQMVTQDGEETAIGSVTDGGVAFQHHPLNSETIRLFREIHPEIGDNMFDVFQEAMALILLDLFPDWQNELAYWD